MAIPWSKVMKSGRPFCPDKNDIFKAFSYCSPDNCKVGSHVMIWRPFISKLLRNLSLYNPDILFVLFGSQASTFRPYINKESTVLEIPHPAYSARTGKKFPLIFNAINEILAKKGKKKIRWI